MLWLEVSSLDKANIFMSLFYLTKNITKINLHINLLHKNRLKVYILIFICFHSRGIKHTRLCIYLLSMS